MRRTIPGVPAAASLDDLIALRQATMARIVALLGAERASPLPGDDALTAVAERLYQDWCALAPEPGAGTTSTPLSLLLHELYDIDHAILSLTDGEPL